MRIFYLKYTDGNTFNGTKNILQSFSFKKIFMRQSFKLYKTAIFYKEYPTKLFHVGLFNKYFACKVFLMDYIEKFLRLD